MKCTHCAKREATVHYTIIEDDKSRVEHLCESCADALSLAETGQPLDKLTAEVREFLADLKGRDAPAITPAWSSAGNTLREPRNRAGWAPWLWLVPVALLIGGLAFLMSCRVSGACCATIAYHRAADGPDRRVAPLGHSAPAGRCGT